jgi:DNA-directed RNA polymerase subunit M/transcription elongation factor TFIIS
VYHFGAMIDLGPAGEFLRVSEHYRRMTDEEIVALARQKSELTEVAQQALASEISHRQLKVQPEEPKTPPRWQPPPVSSEPSPYDDDRQLVEICTVWSLADALQVQQLLDTAGIPFFMGKEKATGVEAVTSKFADGVSVQIMKVGWPWAQAAMEYYEPKDDRTPKEEQDLPEAEVRCPKCRSTEAVFEELVPDAAANPDTTPPRFKWTCDSCGYEWVDDGIMKEQ